jgi:hypothetical protein
MKKVKIFDTLTNKEVEKTLEQYEVAKKFYPGRFIDKKPKTELPKEVKEEKEPKEPKE